MEQPNPNHLPLPAFLCFAGCCREMDTDDPHYHDDYAMFWSSIGPEQHVWGWYCEDCIEDLGLTKGVCLEDYQEIVIKKEKGDVL